MGVDFFISSRLKMTSSGVTGVPSLKRAASRNPKVTEEVGWVARPLGDETVFGGGLVGARDHQRIVDEPQSARRHALDREGVQAVEGAEGELADAAALRRVRVHPVEVLVGPELRLANERQRVMALHLLRRAGGQSDSRDGERRQDEVKPRTQTMKRARPLLAEVICR